MMNLILLVLLPVQAVYCNANGRLEFNLGSMGSAAGVSISNVSLIETSANNAGSKDTGDASILQTEWFKEALCRVNMGFTDAYTNEEGERVISACGMLRYGGSDDVYVISAEMSLDKISVYVNSFVKMENAESFLVNTKDNCKCLLLFCQIYCRIF